MTQIVARENSADLEYDDSYSRLKHENTLDNTTIAVWHVSKKAKLDSISILLIFVLLDNYFFGYFKIMVI